MRRGNLLQTLSGHSSWVYSVAFSPDGQTLVSGSANKTIKLWDVRKGNLLQTLPGHSNCIRSVAFSPDSQTLASGSEDKTIKIWQIKLSTTTGNSSAISVNSISKTTSTSNKSKNTISQKHPTTNQIILVVSVLARVFLTPLLTPFFNSSFFWVIVFGFLVIIFLIFIINKK
nr:hypothetical protein [Nostoc sp. KVJ3]